MSKVGPHERDTYVQVSPEVDESGETSIQSWEWASRGTRSETTMRTVMPRATGTEHDAPPRVSGFADSRQTLLPRHEPIANDEPSIMDELELPSCGWPFVLPPARDIPQ